MPEAVVVECACIVRKTRPLLARRRIGVVDGVQAAPEQRGDRIDDDHEQQQRGRREQHRAERALGEVLAGGDGSVGQGLYALIPTLSRVAVEGVLWREDIATSLIEDLPLPLAGE